MDVNVSGHDRFPARGVIRQTIIQPDGTNWSHQAALYRSAGGLKHSPLEHNDHRRPCCIGEYANQTQPTGTQWSQRAVLYRCAGKSNTANWNTLTATSPVVGLSVCKETKTRMKLTATSCAVSACRQIQNTVGWNKLSATSRTVSVCRGTKILSVGTKWPQKPCSVGLQGNIKQPVGTNLTARMKLLIAFSSFQSLHHRLKVNKHRRDYYARSSTPAWRSKPMC